MGYFMATILALVTYSASAGKGIPQRGDGNGLNERGPNSSPVVEYRRGMRQCERSYLLQTGLI